MIGCAIIVHKDNKIVENLANKIDNLVSNEMKRKKMGKIGKENAVKYGTEQFFLNFINFINSIE